MCESVCVCVYRLPAVPLNGAVVVFQYPGMIEQLLNGKTPLGVHLQVTHMNYKSSNYTFIKSLCAWTVCTEINNTILLN